MTLNFSINSKNKLKNNNTYKYDFVNGGIKINENDTLTITQAIIPNSICNFTSYYNNLDFAYIDNDNVTNKVSLNAGYYTIDDLNKAMQEVMFNKGHYYRISTHSTSYSIHYPLTLAYNKPQYSFSLQKFVSTLTTEQSYYLTNETFSDNYLPPSTQSLLVFGPSTNYIGITGWTVLTSPADIGSITNSPSFTKSDLLITNIAVGANYNKEITINTPISSYNALNINYNYDNNSYNVITITNNITSITCNIYNSSNQLIASPTVSSNVGFNITKTVTLTVNYNDYFEYQQYFLNATINFKPTFQNASDTYRIEMSINQGGYGTGVITNSPSFTKSNSLITNIAVGPYYNKEITINTPISSYNSLFGYNTNSQNFNTTVTHRLLTIVCKIYNSSNQLIQSIILLTTNDGSIVSDISKSVTMTIHDYQLIYYYEYQQFFTNASISFRPELKTTSDTYRVEMSINTLASGVITNSPSFTKSDLLVTNISVGAYYRKSIFLSIPISSYNTGFNDGFSGPNPEIFYHTLNNANFTVYNSLNEIVATHSNGINYTKTVTIYGDYVEPNFYYEQFFTNVICNFTPILKKDSETYRIELSISGVGQWRINTDVSTRVRNNSYSIQFNNDDGLGYTSSNYNETVYNGTGEFRFNTDVLTQTQNDEFNITFNDAGGDVYIGANYTENDFSGEFRFNTNISTHNSVSYVTFNNADGIGYSSANYSTSLYSIGTGAFGNRIYYCNTTIQGLLPPPTTISSLNHFLVFTGYDISNNYNSLYTEYYKIPEGNYIIDIWMSKLLLGSDYIEIITTSYTSGGVIINIETYTIILIDTVNEWNRYSFEFVSTGEFFKFKIDVYGKPNNVIGVGSVKLFKKNELFFIPPLQSSTLIYIINENFLNNILPPNTINVLVTGYNNFNYSVDGWIARSYSTGAIGNRIYYANTSITYLGASLTPPPNSQMLAFFGTGDKDTNGNIIDYNSISQNIIYIPQEKYTFEISMTKRIGGSADYIICVFEGDGGDIIYMISDKIFLNDIPNVWSIYSLSLSTPYISPPASFKVTIYVYPDQYNQLIGISSVNFRQNPVTVINNYKLFPNAYQTNNNEYSLEKYIIGRNTGNSYSTLPTGIPKYGLSMNPINGFTIRCNLIKNNISNTKDFLETIPLINNFCSNNVFRGNDNSLTKIQKGKYRSIQFFLCDQKGNMIILLDPNLFINFCIGVGKPTIPIIKETKKPLAKPIVKSVAKKSIIKPIVKPIVKSIVKTTKPLKITL